MCFFRRQSENSVRCSMWFEFRKEEVAKCRCTKVTSTFDDICRRKQNINHRYFVCCSYLLAVWQTNYRVLWYRERKFVAKFFHLWNKRIEDCFVPITVLHVSFTYQMNIYLYTLLIRVIFAWSFSVRSRVLSRYILYAMYAYRVCVCLCMRFAHLRTTTNCGTRVCTSLI